ncbi:MAG: hypothetical protein M1828_003389 [Chrysothrix sp. TS-e1954]|nr:MAG: hypothetical protein M1828_003389 [Chrysothrix sp. TS-e1954]
MPVPLVSQFLEDPDPFYPYIYTTLKIVPWLAAITLLKLYFGGSRNTSERNMHSKVVMMTGATSGIGASLAHSLATRGAQLVLLTQHPLSDPFLTDYILDMRQSTNNELITAEHVDLSSLHSIRKFATKWVDNAPPRRLDLLILCGTTMTPKGAPLETSEDGVELMFAVNYLANFHLLSILSPALRAQPPDRDVRVLFGTCSSYLRGQVLEQVPLPKTSNSKTPSPGTPQPKMTDPTTAYATSKLNLTNFAQALQKHLSSYVRPDKAPNNARIYLCDPGRTRTPGMRRYLTSGSLFGLALYLLTWPLWWLVLKSPEQGSQTFLYGAMEETLARGEGGGVLRECTDVGVGRAEVVQDEKVQKRLWEVSEKAIQVLEREGAERRAVEKKKVEEDVKKGENAKEREKKAGSRRSRKEKGAEKT